MLCKIVFEFTCKFKRRILQSVIYSIILYSVKKWIRCIYSVADVAASDTTKYVLNLKLSFFSFSIYTLYSIFRIAIFHSWQQFCVRTVWVFVWETYQNCWMKLCKSSLHPNPAFKKSESGSDFANVYHALSVSSLQSSPSLLPTPTG